MHISLLTNAFSKVLMLWLYAAAFSADDANDGSLAVVTTAVGKVEVQTDATSWTAASRGTRLFAENKIRVAAGGSGLVRFWDGSIIRLGEKSEAKILGKRDGNETVADRQVEFSLGNISFDVKKRDGQEFKFSSPTAVAAIKGTEGTVDATNSGTELAIVASSRKDDAAQLQSTKSNKSVTVGVGQSAKADLLGNLTSRLLSEAEREAKRRAISLARDEAEKVIKDLIPKKLQDGLDKQKNEGLKKLFGK